jgi:hypothetical protein
MSRELDPTPAQREGERVARQDQKPIMKANERILARRGKVLPTALPSWGRYQGGGAGPFDAEQGNRVLGECLGNYFGNSNRNDD